VDAGSIVSGTLAAARLPNIDAGLITTGTMSSARIAGRSSGASISNQSAAVNPGVLPRTATLSSAGSTYQIVSFSISLRYQNTNGTAVAPRIQIEVRDGVTVLTSQIFQISVVTGYTDTLSFSGLAIVPPPASSYSVIATDAQFDGGSHSITNAVLSCSSSLIVF
jgi:hypothetical protein